ncbi:MAG TPA: oligosaccharide flippase family protein [Hyphomonadaceae bacterium]|nr:oligosaccharide flippase family protein [Hyphomonadaceae bacterium]
MQTRDAIDSMPGSVAWAAATKWFDVIASTTTFILLAALIGPQAWGLYGMVLVVTALPETIIGGPLAEVLIQQRDLRQGHIAAARVLHLALAAIFAVLAMAAGPWIAAGFGHAEIGTLLPVFAATLLPLAAGAPSTALLQRKLRFRSIAVVDAAGTALATTVGISVALSGGGVWSLMWMEATRRVVRAIAFLVAEGSPISFRFTWRDLRDLTHFNLMTLGAQLLMKADATVPRLAVGAVLGPAALGYFNFAYRLYEQASALVIAPFGAVALPMIARLRDDRERLHQAIRKIMKASAVAAYPAFIGAAAVAPIAIPLILGDTWKPAVSVVQLVLLLGVRSATNAYTGAILRGCGRPELQTANMAIGLVVTCCLVPFVAGLGVEAVAIAMLARAMVVWIIGALLAESASGYRALSQIIVGWRSLVASLVMAGAVLTAINQLSGLPSGWLLPLAIGVGIVVYALVLAALDQTAAREAASTLLRRIVRTPQRSGSGAR